MARKQTNKPRWRLAPIAIAALVLALPAASGAAPFQRLDASAVQSHKLFDLGVADADGDGNLDLFTTNHRFPSSVLLGDGDGGLTESEVALGLNPTPAFPGFEDLDRSPQTAAPGLYLYATDIGRPRQPFHVDTTGIAASGRIVFGSQRLRIDGATNATVTTTPLPDGTVALDFDAQPGARITVTVEHLDLPIGVHVDSPSTPSSIRVGPDAVPATTTDFELTLWDRHAYGFGDFDGNGATDLFVATGGLGGEITDPYFLGRQTDELLLGGSGGYSSATATSGLTKGSCRGRGSIVADFDGDGRLDLLESCDLAPAQIHLGDGAGHFRAAAAPPVAADEYRAIDLIGDRRPEIVAAVGDRVQVWRSAGGVWSRAQRLRIYNHRAPVQELAQGDFDRDGDLDLFAASGGRNTLLLNAAGKLLRRAPAKLGLPARNSFAASFVDYDNDGDLDLDVLPQGLFAQRRHGGFRATSMLRYPPLAAGRIEYGTVSWPDLDTDGRRDPVSARGVGEFALDQVVDLRRNRIRGGHWLEVDLEGPPGNAEAIGAVVRVRTTAGSTWGWVGQSEDSRHSSGHYRLYFGLGEARRIEGLTVAWPDGRRQRLGGRRADRLIRVPYFGRSAE